MPPVPHTPAAEAPDHAALIVALDADDLVGADRARAEALAASCAGCASLLADLGAIRAALPVLPMPPRRRDYRLTEEDAARLRPTRLGRVLDWLAGPRSSVRPLATGLATLGVVGLLVAAGLPGLGGAGSSATMLTTSAPAEEAAPVPGGGVPELGATMAPVPAATAAPNVQAPAYAGPTAAPDDAALAGEASPGPSGERSSATGAADMATEAAKAAPEPQPAGGVSPLAAVSAGLLAAGALLLLARALALRRAA